MLAQISSNLSGVSLVVSIVALVIALFSLPASIKEYLTWIRDVALWLVLAFVAAIVLKAGFQKANREGKPVSQVAIEMFSRSGAATEKQPEQSPQVEQATREPSN